MNDEQWKVPKQAELPFFKSIRALVTSPKTRAEARAAKVEREY